MPALAAALLLLALPGARAQDEPARMPPALGGAWHATSDCSDGVTRLDFRPEGAQADGSAGKASCTYAGLRQIAPARWYLDLDCTAGRRIQLDINALADGRLLVAQRPLGEACFHVGLDRGR